MELILRILCAIIKAKKKWSMKNFIINRKRSWFIETSNLQNKTEIAKE